MTYEPLDIRSQERSREEQKRLQELELDNAAADLKWLMGSRRGRRLMWWILEQSPPRRDPIDTNAIVMARRTGEQRLGIQIEAIALLECPELYLQMIKEHNDGNDSNTSSGDGPKSN